MELIAEAALGCAAILVFRMILRRQEERISREALRKYIRASLGMATY